LRGNHTFSADTSITGNGLLISAPGDFPIVNDILFENPINIGRLAFGNGRTAMNAPVHVSEVLSGVGGVITFHEPITVDPDATLSLVGGQINTGNSSLTFKNSDLNGGGVAGPGNITLTGTVNWSSTSFFGPGKTILTSSSVLRPTTNERFR
jgi:hypothetical protein